MDLDNQANKSKTHEEDHSGDVSDQPHFFNFPFPPYDIQVDLMKVAYETYDKSKFAILESPTGTGKSLSLICSALTWLTDYKNKTKQDFQERKASLEAKIEDLKKEEETTSDWLSVQIKRQDLGKKLNEVDLELERINKFEEKDEARRHAKLHENPLENYAAFGDAEKLQSKTNCQENEISDADVTRLLGSQESRPDVDEEAEMEKKLNEQQDQVKPKLYFASRTHSQLSQFINEIKRTKFSDITQGPTIKIAPLASRANLCVNPDVLKLKDANAINEKCVELQRETNVLKKCPFMKAKQVNLLKEDILSSVQDIEDIVKRGKTLGSCPYYATKLAVPEADVVILPYNNILHHETRKASALDLKDSLVIIDEAHNILETICSTHSVSITGQQLLGSHTILSRYYRKFHNRMSPKNAEAIRMIVQCLTSFIRFLNEPKQHLSNYDNPNVIKVEGNTDIIQCETKNVSSQTILTQSTRDEMMIDVTKFIGSANTERFNIFKILDYFNRSQLARKLLGFFWQDNTLDLSLETFGLKSATDELQSSKRLKEDNQNSPKVPGPKRRKLNSKKATAATKTMSPEEEKQMTNLEFLKSTNSSFDKQDAHMTSYPIYTLVEFLRSLTSLSQDGKIFADHTKGDILKSSLKFILLNPASQFEQMTKDARSIVLAGGTMQPFEEFMDLLFGPLKIERDRLTLFSCGHVVSPEQVYVASLAHGSTGKFLELSYKTRSSFETIDEIGCTIMNLANIVPGGMVCFLPSYDYEQLCFKRWTSKGYIAKIETKVKQVFREPRQANQLKSILDEYSRVVEKGRTTGRGALIFCVVGGKMSEGINFNDDLGRCIVMVGLPYANIKSSELQQKMSYYDRTCSKTTSGGSALSAGQQYYENLCIKGINQSIGRAIRHRKDYAAIILLDRRYASKASVRNGLPGWMRKSLVDHERFGPMFGQLKTFYTKASKVAEA